MTLLTRRTLLTRAGIAMAAAGATRLWPSEDGRTGTPGDPTALTGERRRRFAELVAAVAALEGGGPGGRYIGSATTAFSGWYSRSAGLRAMADHVLDEVAAAGGAHRLLTDVHADAGLRPDIRFGTRGNRRRILAGEALMLASPPFAPDRA